MLWFERHKGDILTFKDNVLDVGIECWRAGD